MRHTFRTLFLAAACLLLAAPPQAEARQPYRSYFAPRPVYPGVYVYPQSVTPPTNTVSPYYSGYPYPTYSPSWYGGYSYPPGSYRYAYTPWGSSYYYTNPSFYYWYRFR